MLSSHHHLPSGSKSDSYAIELSSAGEQRCLERSAGGFPMQPRVSSEGQWFWNPPIPLPHIPWEKVHVWYSFTETRKLILSSIVRVTAWSLAALKNQAQSPILNRPIKEASNCKKQIKNIYSVWPHWLEGQRETMPPLHYWLSLSGFWHEV